MGRNRSTPPRHQPRRSAPFVGETLIDLLSWLACVWVCGVRASILEGRHRVRTGLDTLAKFCEHAWAAAARGKLGLLC
jgi:hypothetical protein